MSGTGKNVRVSFKLSREAAIKLREIALTKGELLCSLGVLAVQLGNESQICISSPLNFNRKTASESCQEGLRKEIKNATEERRVEAAELTRVEAVAASVGSEKSKDQERVSISRDESPAAACQGERDAVQLQTVNTDQPSTIAFANAPTTAVLNLVQEQQTAQNVSSQIDTNISNKTMNRRQSTEFPNMLMERANNSVIDSTVRSTLSKRIRAKKQKSEATTTKAAPNVEETVIKRRKLDESTSNTSTTTDIITQSKDQRITQQSTPKFDNPGLSFAQQLINLSKQYRQENAREPSLITTTTKQYRPAENPTSLATQTTTTTIANDKYFSNNTSQQIVGRDQVLRYFSDKSEDFMGINVNNSLLFDNYCSSSVKSAEELSKEQSEASPTSATNIDSDSSPDSLFEEARLNNVDEISLSPTSTTDPGVQTPSRSESPKSDASNSPFKLKQGMKFQRLLKGQNGIVCELCMHPVQKSYSCYQIAYAPKEIKHLFEDGSRRVRVCRRCLPYKAPKNEKSGSKKGKKAAEHITTTQSQ